MGTSGAYGGPRSGLVPSWLSDPAGGDAPAGAPANGQTPFPPSSQPSAPTPVANPLQGQPAFLGSFGNARASFTKFARSGDSGALRSAVSRYVNKGTGGAQRATVRMGASRAVAGRLLSVAREAQTAGAAQALQRFNLGALAGRPAADVFLSLMEIMCPPGGSISEAISRQAMLEAINHLADAGAVNFDDLTPGQWEEFILDFISGSIEEKIIGEIGAHMIELPPTVTDLDALENQLHDFISGSVREALVDRLPDLATLSDADTAATVNSVYEAAFNYLSLLGDGS